MLKFLFSPLNLYNLEFFARSVYFRQKFAEKMFMAGKNLFRRGNCFPALCHDAAVRYLDAWVA